MKPISVRYFSSDCFCVFSALIAFVFGLLCEAYYESGNECVNLLISICKERACGKHGLKHLTLTITQIDSIESPNATNAAAPHSSTLKATNVVRVPILSTRIPPKKGSITFGVLHITAIHTALPSIVQPEAAFNTYRLCTAARS